MKMSFKRELFTFTKQEATAEASDLGFDVEMDRWPLSFDLVDAADEVVSLYAVRFHKDFVVYEAADNKLPPVKVFND